MTGLLFFCLKIDQKTLAGIGAMAVSHTGFFACSEKLFKFFWRKRQNIHSPKAKEWRGKRYQPSGRRKSHEAKSKHQRFSGKGEWASRCRAVCVRAGTDPTVPAGRERKSNHHRTR